MPSHSIAICVRIIAAGCKRRKYGNTKRQGCKVKVVLSKLLMLDDASEGVHISKQSLRQSIHQHHDRDVRRRCILNEVVARVCMYVDGLTSCSEDHVHTMPICSADAIR